MVFFCFFILAYCETIEGYWQSCHFKLKAQLVATFWRRNRALWSMLGFAFKYISRQLLSLVLVASILVNHEQHSACIPWLTRVKRGENQGFIGTHTLAELYSILSAFPAKPRLSPQLVQQLMRDNLAPFEVMSLMIDKRIRMVKSSFFLIKLYRLV